MPHTSGQKNIDCSALYGLIQFDAVWGACGFKAGLSDFHWKQLRAASVNEVAESAETEPNSNKIVGCKTKTVS